jgi:c-di-GMP-binding flagellar brake protein YcgR
MLREWSTFTARFFSGQHAFAFTTNVVKQTNIPYPMLHLSYPKTIQTQQIRKNPRIEVDLIMVAEDEARRLQVPSKIYDLSATGASIGSNDPLGAVGDRFTAKFEVNVQDLDAMIEVVCQIRNRMPPPGNGAMKHGYGVSFHEVDQDMQFALAAFVSGTMLDKM